jgi:hypothetical protein
LPADCVADRRYLIGFLSEGEDGLTVTAYASLLLRRRFERAVGEESVLAYDHVDNHGESHIDRDPDEGDETYRRRSTLYGSLFDRRG